MSIITQIGIFVIVWWVVLFVTLPLWVQGQVEQEDVEPGTDPGAPVNPNLGRKFLLTTAIALAVTIAIIAGISFGVFDRFYQYK